MGWKLGAVLLALAGCSESVRDEMPMPRLEITCPDPSGRARLADGATYRDLAASRLEAVSGWRQCHDALAIAQKWLCCTILPSCGFMSVRQWVRLAS